MAVLANSFDGGTPGTALTAANSGGASGDAFDVVDPSASPILYTSDALHGAAAVEFDAVDDDPIIEWTSGVSAVTTYGRVYVKFAAYPPDDINVVRHLAGAQTVITVRVGSSGRIGLLYATGTFAGNGTQTIPLNTWVRLEWAVTTGIGTGSVQADLYLSPESETPDDTLSAANVDTATAAAVTVQRMGMISSETWAFVLDSVAFSDEGPIGPVSTGGGPIVQAVGTATATSTAQSVGAVKNLPVGDAGRTAAARTLAGSKRAAANPAASTSTAQGLDRAKRLAIGTAASTHTGRTVGVTGSTVQPVTPADGTSAARPVGRAKRLSVGTAHATTTAHPAARGKTRPTGSATSTGAARTIGPAKQRAVGTAARTGSAQPVTLPGVLVVPTAPAHATGAARPVGSVKALAVGTATAVGSARPVRSGLSVTVGTATTSTSARALGHAKTLQLDPATGTATARTIGGATGVDELPDLRAYATVSAHLAGTATTTGLTGAANATGRLTATIS